MLPKYINWLPNKFHAYRKIVREGSFLIEAIYAKGYTIPGS
jgi:hypothetical protein